MREVSRYKSVQVLPDYVCDSDLLRDHAGKISREGVGS